MTVQELKSAFEDKIGIKPEFYIAEIGDGACKLI